MCAHTLPFVPHALGQGSKSAAGKVGSTKGPDVLPEAKQLTTYLAR